MPDEEDKLIARSVWNSGSDLDAQATSEFRNRLSEIKDELNETHDEARIATLQREQEQILRELEQAYRPKRDTETERIRQKVGHAIKDALGKIEQKHPALYKHLNESLAHKTGAKPIYQPPALPLWLL